MNELISVIVPVYNVEKYLERCIDSIIKQTYKNLQIIIVDDGSIDNSSLICDKYVLKDERIKVIHKKNGGLSDARNAGLKIASGKFYAFIDSDDFITDNTIEIMYKAIIQTNSDIAICNMLRFYDDGNTSEFYCPCTKMTIYKDNERFQTLNQPSVCNKLFKAELFQNISFPYGKFYEDTYIYHELLYKAKNIVLTGHVGYMYFSRKESIIGQLPQYTDRYFDFIEAVWLRARFLLDHKVDKYSIEACLSYYAAMVNMYKNIKLSSTNNELYNQSIKQYKKLYHIMIKSNISYKQKVRLFLLRYFPKIHCRIY